MTIKPWTILSSKQVLRDSFMGLRTDRCQREDGHIVEAYHVTELTDWVTVIPVTTAGNVVLVREYRHAAQVVMVGLPGGVSDPHEKNWADVGARELREETGYVPGEMVWVGTCYPNPATQNNKMHFYLALGCTQDTGQELDPNEDIEVLEMPYREFLDYGQLDVQHALHAAGLFYAERHFLKHPHHRPKE